MIPVCSPADPYCYDENKVINWSLIAVGLATGLVAWWIGSFGQMVAAHVVLGAKGKK
jgi:hypothetical protein